MNLYAKGFFDKNKNFALRFVPQVKSVYGRTDFASESFVEAR